MRHSSRLIRRSGSALRNGDWRFLVLVSECLSPGAFAYINNNRFGETVLCAHPVLVPEKLQEPQATFEDRCSISKGALDGLPHPEPFAGQRYDSRARQHLAQCPSI